MKNNCNNYAVCTVPKQKEHHNNQPTLINAVYVINKHGRSVCTKFIFFLMNHFTGRSMLFSYYLTKPSGDQPPLYICILKRTMVCLHTAHTNNLHTAKANSRYISLMLAATASGYVYL